MKTSRAFSCHALFFVPILYLDASVGVGLSAKVAPNRAVNGALNDYASSFQALRAKLSSKIFVLMEVDEVLEALGLAERSIQF